MPSIYAPSTQLRGVKGTFFRALTGVEKTSYAPVLAETMQSDGADEKLVWVGEAPQMVELTDELDFKPLSDTNYTISNTIFKAGLAVTRQQLDDQQFLGITKRVQQMAMVAGSHKNKLLNAAIVNATTVNCYDGVPLISNSHPDRGVAGVGTQDNLLAGSGTTTANFQTDINAAFVAMKGFKAENGEPFTEDFSNMVLYAHDSMRKPVLEALNASLISNTSNVAFAGLNIRPFFTSRLTDTNDWYLLNMAPGLSSLIILDRDPLEFNSLQEGERALIREQYLYEARWRGNVGYQFWQSIVKTTNT